MFVASDEATCTRRDGMKNVGENAMLLTTPADSTVWVRGIIPDERCKGQTVFIFQRKVSPCQSLSFPPRFVVECGGEYFLQCSRLRRLARFVNANSYIDSSVQKASIPGCIEHANMIWCSIKQAHKDRIELNVVWLDLANAYGSGAP